MDITDRFSKQITNFLDFNILIPVDLIHYSDTILKQEVEQISSNFADIINIDIDKTILIYQLNSEILLLKQSLKSTDQLLTKFERNAYLFERRYLSENLFIHRHSLNFACQCFYSRKKFFMYEKAKSLFKKSNRQERLTGLALIYIHRDIHLDINKIINYMQEIPKEN
jgi:hypothetical protein